jgi:hypothetical protein
MGVAEIPMLQKTPKQQRQTNILHMVLELEKPHPPHATKLTEMICD